MRQTSLANDLGTIDRSSTEMTPSICLTNVLDEFHRQKICYCYWKSSRRLPAVFAGKTDLDLLIVRRDQHRAQAILLGLDFKHFPSVGDRDHPATSTFLGYDETSGQLIHVHLHFRLIISPGLLANYCVPWEEALLARAVRHATLPARVLDPPSEAVLLVVRACLELGRSGFAFPGKRQAILHKFALDRAYLAGSVDRAAVRSAAVDLLDSDLADQVADALYGGRPLQQWPQLRRRIKKHLAEYRTYNGLELLVRSVGLAAVRAAGKLNKHVLRAPRTWNRRAPGGGFVVAIVGVDGSGKSSAVAAILAWLGSKIDVIPVYFGTGDGRPSLWLWPFKVMLPLMTRLLRKGPKAASHTTKSDGQPGLSYRALLMFWAAAVALDKRKKLTAARRGTNRGLIVLTDRYPQDQIRSYNDGPLLSRLSGVPQWLCRLEAGVYARARRPAPDLVIKLTVTPETAARREPTMDPAVIRQRIVALQHLSFPGARIVNVDAERPLPEVIGALKREIWCLI